MNTNHAELPNLHCHFDRWIEAAADNRLSPQQQHVLDRHLAECTICMRQCESEKTLSTLEAELEANGTFDHAFETCCVLGFEQDLQYESNRPRFPLSVRLRTLITIAALLVLIAHVTVPGIGAVVTSNTIVAAAQQMILNSPDYTEITQSAMIAAEDHLPLAALHKLTTTFTETLAWIVLFFGVRHVCLRAIRKQTSTKTA